MKRLLLLAVLLAPLIARAQPGPLHRAWHVGIELGELPMHGSFKPGLTLGMHVNDHVYVGAVYQIADRIRRDGTSFNAESTGLDGLVRSSERVGQRAMLQARVRPHRKAPFVSMGFVFNDRDTESMAFDARSRSIGEHVVDGPISIEQSRAAAWRPSLGLGYSWVFASGLEVHTEWAGWWLTGAPDPDIRIEADALATQAEEVLTRRMREHFTSSPFNTYHMFQLGLGYTW